ncbi:MAG: DNA replication and repair protein RecF [Pseudomonadales bacterium]|nr:DNA replication and repair protein RecF [Pseudomonadales bacterium]
MLIDQLDIYKFRNISQARASLHKFNLILGPNGGGKTSVLEAIYFLSSCKSFRTTQINTLIQNQEQETIIRAATKTGNVGLQRHRNAKVSIRKDNNNVNKISEITRLLPVHVVEPNSVSFVEGSPSERRKFLDFSMFHVEHLYLNTFKAFANSLKQRNAILRKGGSLSDLKYWNPIYIESAWSLNVLRKRLYDEVIAPGIRATLEFLGEDLDVAFEYSDGCKSAQNQDEFLRFLEQSLEQDTKFKSTQLGPHRADIILKSKGKIAKDYLSRGQKKLLTYGVRLAPALMLNKRRDSSGIILIDDMPSELDKNSIIKVCSLLKEVSIQTALTAVDTESEQTKTIKEMLEPEMFHVEHGVLKNI